MRREEEGDREAVARVHREAFGDHGERVADLVEALRASVTPSRGASLVAEDDGQIVGHVMFSPSLLDAPDRLVEVQVLSPLGVLPSHQGRGVGSELVGAGLQLMEEQGVPLVFLEGDPGYYQRLGFVRGGEHGFRRPSLRIPEAGFQVHFLSCFEPSMTGTLVYSETFWRLDLVGLRRAE